MGFEQQLPRSSTHSNGHSFGVGPLEVAERYPKQKRVGIVVDVQLVAIKGHDLEKGCQKLQENGKSGVLSRYSSSTMNIMNITAVVKYCCTCGFLAHCVIMSAEMLRGTTGYTRWDPPRRMSISSLSRSQTSATMWPFKSRASG